MKVQRRPNGGFDRAETPSHLIRRCQQYSADLYAHEAGSCELTKQQFTVLAALENNEGVSQTALLDLLPETYQKALEQGLRLELRLKRQPAAVAVRVAVVEERGGHVGSLSVPLTLHAAQPGAQR